MIVASLSKDEYPGASPLIGSDILIGVINLVLSSIFKGYIQLIDY